MKICNNCKRVYTPERAEDLVVCPYCSDFDVVNYNPDVETEYEIDLEIPDE